jgi:hypothetical protein
VTALAPVLALVVVALAAAPPARAGSSVEGSARRDHAPLTCTVDDASGPLYVSRPAAGDGGRSRATDPPRELAAGDAVHGLATLWTAPGVRARLVFPGGWSVHLGPATRVQVAAGSSPGAPGGRDGAFGAVPVLLLHGSVRVENRPGDAGAPPVVVATRYTEVHVPADGRALVALSRQTGGIPRTFRVAALRREALVVQPDGSRRRAVAEGRELTGAGWIAVERWQVRSLARDERARLEVETLTRAEAVTATGPRPLIPPGSLLLDGSPLPEDRKIYLSRADVPPEGEFVVTGRVHLEWLPPEIGTVHVAASRDGGTNWERLRWTDADGGFAYAFGPQDGLEYRLVFAVHESATGKPQSSTGTYSIQFREKFTPAFSDLTLCGAPFPPESIVSAAGEGAPPPEPPPDPYVLYADELSEFVLVLAGSLSSDAPLARVRIDGSGDGGVHWRAARVTVAPDGESGTFRVAFPAIPGAAYRFRLRSTYAREAEVVEPHRPLSDWEAPVPVRYEEARSTDRARALVRLLDRALARRDGQAVRALLAPLFVTEGRDLSRLRGRLRMTPGESVREPGALHVAVDWESEEPDGRRRGGRAIFLLVKDLDWVLLDVLGDDPFSTTPSLVERLPSAAAAPGEPDEGAGSALAVALESTHDFESGRTSAYSPRVIPDDLAYFRDEIGARSVPVLGTHDRRLAVLGRMSLANVAGLDESGRGRLEYRARIVPEPGTTYTLRTRQGNDVLFEVVDASEREVRIRHLPPEPPEETPR